VDTRNESENLMMNAIDQEIAKIKPELFTRFTNKWSQHTHTFYCQNCNRTVTLDGNWKIKRRKCAYDCLCIKTKEFGKIITGCRDYPMKNSYFCRAHKGKELIFKGPDGNKVSFVPARIAITRMSIY
jgi:hypothetical protein